MRLYISLLCFALIALTGAIQDDNSTETVEVNSPVGKVRGSIMTSRLGKKIYSFRGLRYAEPPVGEKRFKVPVPIIPWKGVFDATQEGPSCPQIGGKLQSEDCLRLNVYTTKLPSATKSRHSKNSKRPVIVFFHPGAFYVFSGQSWLVGPQYLLDQDVVLVTVNNRLGTLGWVSTGDALAPGNLGLKDQVVALRWIRDNIASFGGDPNSVTITGYSAGAWSVALHLVSPMTKGLFHRAIAMSGSPIYFTPLPHEQTDLAQRQARVLGCPTDSTSSILDCLKTKPAQELGDSLTKLYEWNNHPMLLWSPVVEPDIPGVERYLTEQPGELIRQGKMHDVPLIVGVTKDEFGGGLVGMVEEGRKGNVSSFQQFNDEWETAAPISIGYERDTPRSREISRALKQFYLKGKPISLDNWKDLARLFTDTVKVDAHRLVTLAGANSRAPVYYYEFTYQGRYSHSVWSDTKKPYGVVHHDDMMYLFYLSYFPYFEENSPEIPTVERMTSMWVNFAKTGEPIPRNNPIFTNITWTPFTVQNKKYLQIGNELVMKRNLNGESMNEWDRIFPYQITGKKSRNSN